MSVGTLITFDLLVAVLIAATWLGAGAAAAARRSGIALALFVAAAVLSVARAATAAVLAGAGWWFVQEKVTLTLPLLAVAGVVAAAVAGPRLVRAARGGRADLAGRPAVVVPLLGAGYAAVAGPVYALLLGYPATWSAGLVTVALVGAAVLLTWRIVSAPGSLPVSAARAAVAAALAAGLAGTGLAFVPAPETDAGGGVPTRHLAAGHPADGRTAGTTGAPAADEHATGTGAAHAAGTDTTGEHAPEAHGSGGSATGEHAPEAHEAGAGGVRPVTALRGPSEPAPGGTTRRFALTARTTTVTLSSGRRVAAWTFDGKVPGPPITAVEGDLVEVRLRNADVTSGVTIHWHGYDVPAGEDGVPGLTQDAVRPGQEFTYRFLADQVGTYWYHTHEVSDIGVRKGLYGMLVVTSRAGGPADHVSGSASGPASDGETGRTQDGGAGTGGPAVSTPGLDLTLPVHTFGGVTVIGDHDRTIERSAAPGTPVRLRLVNTDNTPHRFTLAGAPYRLVAVDGQDLNGPGELGRVGLRLPAGGRYDLAFTMPAARTVLLAVDDRTDGLRLSPREGAPAPGATSAPALGTTGPSTSRAPVPESGPGTAPGAGSGTAGSAGVSGSAGDGAGWPELDITRYGTPAGTPFGLGSRFDRRFTLVLDRGLAFSDGRPLYAHTVNGRAFPSIPTQVVRDGELVRFTVVNRSRDTHPWHLHGHRVLVLSRDGRPTSGSPLWLDTFDVRPGEVWEVAFRAANPGLWMNHCHNLAHADQGMVLHLNYEDVTTPFHGAHGG
ncbi:multicopper oxidase family protein [Streptosporangium sandarakinum]|uniref:multicopper oxidase family protein n=1 Tax=Streptosporangium sandarakinum TaxID=1260955 RepID=UPI0033AB6EAC